MFPREVELGLPGRAKSVKRFELSNGLDTALCKAFHIHVFNVVISYLHFQIVLS